jgi:regulator of protease activity HflC (stomatin/prohibitin superfamily)
MDIAGFWILVVAAAAVVLLSLSVKILREYERGVIFRLGKFSSVKGPGLFLIIPVIDNMIKVDIRVVSVDVPRQEIITKDNVSAVVDAVVYYRVDGPSKAIISVSNYFESTFLIAQTTLRSILGQADLDELLSQRDKINQKLQAVIDQHTEPWGIKVILVEIKDIVLPETMKRAMAKQAESERERRAKVINAEGEFQASTKLVEAAKIMNDQPVAVQLRYLQTLSEISTENSSTIVFPVPLDMVNNLLKLAKKE